MIRLLPILFLSLLTVSCITEDVPDNTRRGNFEALWQTLDSRYCFFAEKQAEYGLDWNEVRTRYGARIDERMSGEELFRLLGEMTCELRDGHVNLSSAMDVARYGAWYDDYPANYSDSLERRYLGRAEEHHVSSGMKYRILDDNVGYVRIASFTVMPGNGNLHEMVRSLSLCDGLIIDVRNNGGGLLTAAEKVASLFFNESETAGYIRHKTGTGHADFSAPQPIRIEPFEGLRWQKSVCVLTNRRSYSATNSFVMYLKGRPGVTIVGDRTGGGAGMPLTAELPAGWTVRFSACPLYDRAMGLTEGGIDPDVRVDITAEDYARSVDTIIEKARALLRSGGKSAVTGSSVEEMSDGMPD